MRVTTILKSGPFRIAIVFAAIVTVTTYLVFAFVYLRFYSANVSLARSVLETEVGTTRDMPLARLRKQLELRLTQDLRRLDYVGLYDKDGRLIFGNVAPTLAFPLDGKAHKVAAPPPQVVADRGDRDAEAIFVATERPDGGSLVLGRSLVYVDQVQTEMLSGFALAVIPVILVALVAGIIVSLRASRRLTMIQHAINRVMDGELDVRLPARGKPDDIDALVRSVNLMLDEIVRLINQVKSVGDNIAHDLRAPLAVMRARLERGLAGSSEATLRALTVEALDDLERAMTTVTALLRISELESGLRRRAFGEVDLAEICGEVFELYEPLAAAKDVALVLQAQDTVPVVGDGDLLREALANLVDNAIKFTPEGGRVEIDCGPPDALVRVADTGPGIPPEERDKVVRRFYRSPRTAATPGNGLGLSMAATIVGLHGLDLRIGDNRPGAVFEIVAGRLPAGDARAKRAEFEAATPYGR